MKAVSYNNLKKLMIDKNMKRKDLLQYFNSTTVTKLWNNENVSMDTILKLCELFDCAIEDVVTCVDVADSTN